MADEFEIDPNVRNRWSERLADPQTARIALALRIQQGQLRAQLTRFLAAPGYPFDRFWNMLLFQRTIGVLQEKQLQIATIDTLVNQIEIQQATLIERVYKLDTFPEIAQRALAAGLPLAVAGAGLGALIGSAVPVIGTIVGAVVGFIVGIVSAIIPFEKWNALNAWRSSLDGMMVVERYLVLKSTRVVADKAREMQSPDAKKLQKWAFREPGVFYTIWTADGFVNFEWEEILFRDCFPWPQNSTIPADPWQDWHLLDPVVHYALGCLCGSGDPTGETAVRDLPWVQAITQQNRGSQWLKPYLTHPSIANRASPEVIAKVRNATNSPLYRGLRDFDDQPYPDHVLDLVKQRESERAAQLARVSK